MGDGGKEEKMTVEDIVELYNNELDNWQCYSDSQKAGITEDGYIRVCLRNYKWYETKEPIKDAKTALKAIFEIDWIAEYDSEEYDSGHFINYSDYWKKY